MLSSIRRKFDTWTAVREFAAAHPFTEPAHAALVARFGTVLDLAKAAAVGEQRGRLVSRAATRHRKEVRRELVSALRYLSQVGEMAAADAPNLASRFPAASIRLANATLLARATTALTLAEEQLEVLGKHGLAPSQVDEFTTLVSRFDAATREALGGRSEHIAARGALAQATDELMDLLRLLDTLYQNRGKSDPKLLAAWLSARNVANPAPIGPATPPADETGTATGEVAKAA